MATGVSNELDDNPQRKTTKMTSIKTAEELKALTDKGTVVVDFGATWCPPCNRLAPIFSEVSQLEEFKNISFVKIDIEEASELANDYGVTSIPHLIVLKEGKVAASQMGLISKTALVAWVTKSSQ